MRTGESYDYKNKADDPPHSRLFIICSKSLTEDDFRSSFTKFGTIEEVWIVRDRQSGDPKGVAYIKYAKTSEAALAMESMNGETIADNTRPLKVMIASSKDQGSKREDNEDRLLRLFIVVPKTMTDDDVIDYFRKYGDLDYVNVVKDRETKESKGIAYVKFHRMYHAAKAFEECDRSFKAVFARPKESAQDRHSFSSAGPVQGGGGYGNRGSFFPGPGDIINNFPNPEGFTRLCALVVPALTQDMVAQLFDIVPGMEVCRFTSDGRSYNSRKVLIQYSTPQAAAYARDKLQGIEFPPGHRISIKPDLDYGPSAGYVPNMKNDSYPMSGPDYSHRMGYKNDMIPDGPSNSNIPNGIVALTKALAEATQVIQKAGLLPNSGGGYKGDVDMADPSYCSVKLPPPQPLAPADSKCIERLFIVCQPLPPPVHALWDVFGRFGHLIEVYLLTGKNCGYVSYGCKESADQAVQVLHGQEICRMRVKVMLAEPRKTGEGGGRKRLRTDLDN